ncbi:hypothetical protein BDQ17DRAFT_1244386 [Cyathus striatus]|nr:hypothetical protein BDQ17DRAFT_1244386 [Cyathus striatus]
MTSSPIDTSDISRTSSLSSTITALVACITPMIGLLYFCALTWTYKFSRRNPRPLNKTSGVRLQRYAPLVYIFLVLSSLAEVAISSWLILQYRFHHNYPSIVVRNGTRFILFCASWTSGIGGAYSVLFLHPTWSRHPVSSIGTQALWVFITWIFWVAGAGTINTAIPTLLMRGQCDGIAYCGQLRSLFGKENY